MKSIWKLENAVKVAQYILKPEVGFIESFQCKPLGTLYSIFWPNSLYCFKLVLFIFFIFYSESNIYLCNNAVPLQVGALIGYDDIMIELLTFFLAASNDVINMWRVKTTSLPTETLPYRKHLNYKKVSICYNPTEFEKVSLINKGVTKF